jgi:alkanesulfonate monooxygenase
VAAIRSAAEAGRNPAEILMFGMMTTIVAPTDEEAAAKLADDRRYVDLEGALTLMSGLDRRGLFPLRSGSGC